MRLGLDIGNIEILGLYAGLCITVIICAWITYIVIPGLFCFVKGLIYGFDATEVSRYGPPPQSYLLWEINIVNKDFWSAHFNLELSAIKKGIKTNKLQVAEVRKRLFELQGIVGKFTLSPIIYESEVRKLKTNNSYVEMVDAILYQFRQALKSQAAFSKECLAGEIIQLGSIVHHQHKLKIKAPQYLQCLTYYKDWVDMAVYQEGAEHLRQILVKYQQQGGYRPNDAKWLFTQLDAIKTDFGAAELAKKALQSSYADMFSSPLNGGYQPFPLEIIDDTQAIQQSQSYSSWSMRVDKTVNLDNSTEALLTVQRIYAQERSCRVPRGATVFNAKNKPDASIELSVKNQKLRKGLYEVTMQFNSTVKMGNVTAYEVEVLQTGIFQIRPCSKEKRRQLLVSECASILYPHLQKSVYDMTQATGLSPQTLPTVNFEEQYQQEQQHLHLVTLQRLGHI